MSLDPICEQARSRIEAFVRDGDGDEGILAATLDGILELDETQLDPETAAAELAARHIAECPACRRWRDAKDPARAARRERLARYCCARMAVAIEDPAAPVRFSFTMFRGEDPCWCIGEDWSFARFCPWCGRPLPDDALEEPSA